MHLAEDIQLEFGVAGGLVIGVASSALLFYTGKVTGISGIVEKVIISDGNDDSSWTISYVAGLLTSGVILSAVYPTAFGAPSQMLILSPVGYAAAGLLTGFGSRMGSGCTSGHGICGLPRRSLRSLSAVLTFMGTGALSSYLITNPSLKQLLASEQISNTGSTDDLVAYITPTITCAVIGATLYHRGFILHKLVCGQHDEGSNLKVKTNIVQNPFAQHTVSFLAAITFGLGLGLSGMCNTGRVTNFLNFTGPDGWDPTLMGVMGGGVLFNLISFHFMNAKNVPIALDKKSTIANVLKFDTHPDNMKIDQKLLIGSAIFGLGWGLGNLVQCILIPLSNNYFQYYIETSSNSVNTYTAIDASEICHLIKTTESCQHASSPVN